MDTAPAPSLAPAGKRAEVATNLGIGLQTPALIKIDPARTQVPVDENSSAVGTFSSSLITSEELNDC
jgi:hypothetical protein